MIYNFFFTISVKQQRLHSGRCVVYNRLCLFVCFVVFYIYEFPIRFKAISVIVLLCVADSWLFYLTFMTVFIELIAEFSFSPVQLFSELLESMALGSSKDDGDFVSADDVCWKIFKNLFSDFCCITLYFKI